MIAGDIVYVVDNFEIKAGFVLRFQGDAILVSVNGNELWLGQSQVFVSFEGAHSRKNADVRSAIDRAKKHIQSLEALLD